MTTTITKIVAKNVNDNEDEEKIKKPILFFALPTHQVLFLSKSIGVFASLAVAVADGSYRGTTVLGGAWLGLCDKVAKLFFFFFRWFCKGVDDDLFFFGAGFPRRSNLPNRL